MNNPVAGVHALLITPDGKIILQQKSLDYVLNPSNKGKISMYGGGVEADEDLREALKRELYEELRFAPKDESIEDIGVYHKTTELDGIDQDVHVYVIRDVDSSSLVEDTSDDEESAARMIIDTAENLLADPLLTRITRLALTDFSQAN